MNETLISPGVLVQENDNSFVTKGPISVGAAIVGPTAKGPVNIPTVVTTYSEYDTIFGGSIKIGNKNQNYLTGISVSNYFQQGGKSLLVTRVAEDNGSNKFTSAVGTISISVDEEDTIKSVELYTISKGEDMNGDLSLTMNGSMINGTRNNIRWEVTSSSTEAGTFNLNIRRGDDTTKNKIVLESWRNLSLDPESPNYIERIIGNTTFEAVDEDGETYINSFGDYANKSNYITAKVITPTPNYFDNDGNVDLELSGLIPLAQEGVFLDATGRGHSPSLQGGANHKFFEEINGTNTQGWTVTTGGVVEAYDIALKLLANKSEYRFNVISAPGLLSQYHSDTVKRLAAIASDRKDCIAVIDLAGFDQKTVSAVVGFASEYDTSYVATYWPWLQTMNGGKTVWIPASTMIPGVYAFTDVSSEPWFAPAGMLRGGLNMVIQPSKKLTSGNKNQLYSNNINPIGVFPSNGVVVFGQKTLQRKPSALDRVNVRRLLIEVKDKISQIADTLVFEQNTASTRNNFLAKANPYMETIQQRQGLYAFKLVMDDSNNDAASIDRNELRGQVILQPTKTVEFISLDFTVAPTGADFDQF